MLNTLNEECEKLNYQPRSVQTQAIKWLESVWNSSNICKVLSLSVGAGKSLISKTIAEHNKKQGKITAIITPSNILIDQYIKEFPDVNYFKGKTNYKCEKTQSTCEEGLEFAKVSKKPCENCPYDIAKQRCYDESITIFNPISLFVLPKTFKTDFGFEPLYQVDTIIVDEVQSLPSMLRELMTIKIWSHDIRWQSGVSSSMPEVIKLMREYSNKLSHYIFNPKIEGKEKAKLLISQRRTDILCTQLVFNSSFFICEETTQKYRNLMTDCLIIRPKYVPPSVYTNFFKHASRVIFMSGTAFPHIWEELGYKKVDYLELPSPIPVERRQIFVTNSINMSHKTKTQEILDQLATEIRYITEEIHPDENGVILLTYSLAEELKLRLTEDYFVHMEKKTKKDQIDEFKANTKRRVGLFSGSFEGLSLDDDVSRFTIIPKIPFASLTDKVVQVRMKENELHYQLETMTNIIQGSGRSTRSDKDFSTIYILDSNFSRLFATTRKYLPAYFIESIRWGMPNNDYINLLKTFRGEKKCA